MLRSDEDVYVPAHLNFGKTILDQLRSMGDEVAIVSIISTTIKTFYFYNLTTSAISAIESPTGTM